MGVSERNEGNWELGSKRILGIRRGWGIKVLNEGGIRKLFPKQGFRKKKKLKAPGEHTGGGIEEEGSVQE